MRKYDDFSLKSFNTFGLDVKTKSFVEYESPDDLLQLDFAKPYLFVGRGSNLLFTKDYEGTIVHCGITGINIDEETDDYVDVRVGAGEIWDDFVEYAVLRGWSGLENLSLIPGEVGAAAVQNIGAYGVEAKDVIHSVEFYHIPTKQILHKAVTELKYGYRTSIFKTDWVGQCAICSVVFRLSKVFSPKLEYGKLKENFNDVGTISPATVRQKVIEIRNSKLPKVEELGSAGSFFMNPIVSKEVAASLLQRYPEMPHYNQDGGVKIPAGWMIEQCGWKGKTLGRAGVYAKQALVLVNLGDAKGEDIVKLSESIQKDVKQKFGIEIHPEVNFI